MGCCGHKDEFGAENADSPDFCTASPETYARDARLSKSVQVGAIFAVLGGCAAHYFTQGVQGVKGAATYALGTGAAALVGNYAFFGESIMSQAQDHYSQTCPAYTGGADEEQEEEAEEDNADTQP